MAYLGGLFTFNEEDRTVGAFNADILTEPNAIGLIVCKGTVLVEDDFIEELRGVETLEFATLVATALIGFGALTFTGTFPIFLFSFRFQ